MKKQTTTTTILTWDSEFGRAQADIIDGILNKVMIHKRGAIQEEDVLRVTGGRAEPFIRHVHQCLTELLEVLGEEDEK